MLLPQRYKFSSKSQLFYNTNSSFISCCCYRKGTNFQANHNQSFVKWHHCQVVVATAKVQIFKQITTSGPAEAQQATLLLLPQRYKFSSKSQPKEYIKVLRQVVVATAKVQIFKQITTVFANKRTSLELLLLPQRYKFSSKSQRKHLPHEAQVVVVATAKVQIFKQITTIIWSNKQEFGCCCYRKGTNFQANHNR